MAALIRLMERADPRRFCFISLRKEGGRRPQRHHQRGLRKLDDSRQTADIRVWRQPHGAPDIFFVYFLAHTHTHISLGTDGDNGKAPAFATVPKHTVPNTHSPQGCAHLGYGSDGSCNGGSAFNTTKHETVERLEALPGKNKRTTRMVMADKECKES